MLFMTCKHIYYNYQCNPKAVSHSLVYIMVVFVVLPFIYSDLD